MMKLICLTTQQGKNFITNITTYTLNYLQNHQLTKSSTQKLTNSSTYKTTNLPTHQLTNSKAQTNINLQTHQLENSSTYKLTNSSTYNLINIQVHKLTNSSTYKLKNSKNIDSQTYKFTYLNSCFLFYETTQNFDSFQRKYWLKRRQIYTISNLSRLLHCLFLSIEPAFCTILPFQLLANSYFFQPQLSAFSL